jgi:hypothetical protein
LLRLDILLKNDRLLNDPSKAKKERLLDIFSENERMIQSKTDTALVANPRPLLGLPGDLLQGFTLSRWH